MVYKSKMVEERTWDEFGSAGLFWFVNMIIHVFGWAIVTLRDKNSGEIVRVFPARVKFRGFGEKDTTEGYRKLSMYIMDNINQLVDEANS
jgi:hypothetical protein